MARLPKLFDGRRRPFVVSETWTAIRNPAGIWVIVDETGQNPLRHIDSVTRLNNVHLAAKAPELKAMVRELRDYLVSRAIGDQDFIDKLHWTAGILLFETRPLYVDVIRASGMGMQVVLELECEDEAEAA